MKQAFKRFLGKFEVNNYQPFSTLNIVLALIAFCCFSMTVLAFKDGATFSQIIKGSDSYSGMNYLFFAGVICFVVLIVRNLKIKSIPKIILYSVLQIILGVIIGFIFFLIFILASFLGGSSSSSSSNYKTYTDEEEKYAKAKGYYDANDANEKGFDTTPANNPGFDYNQ